MCKIIKQYLILLDVNYYNTLVCKFLYFYRFRFFIRKNSLRLNTLFRTKENFLQEGQTKHDLSHYEEKNYKLITDIFI